jgi:outer membrane usher protein
LPGAAPGSGYRLTADSAPSGRNFDASESTRSSFAQSTLDVGSSNGAGYASASIDGIVGVLDGRPFDAPDSGQSFAIVDVPGYSGIRVSVNGEDSGRTDARGRIFLNTLQPFQRNEVRIAADDFPIDADVGNALEVVAPYSGAGAVVRFDVQPLRAVMIRVTDDRGRVLAPGTLFGRNGTAQTWPVGEDGLLYLTHVPAVATTYRGSVDGRLCAITVSLPAGATSVTRVPSQICHQ